MELLVHIDRGGTFTDCIAVDLQSGREIVVKLLSVDPSNYADAPTEGIRRILEQASRSSIPRSAKVPTQHLKQIRMATTVATNALLERKGEPSVLIVTKGFEDALKIGNQARPNIFDLSIESYDVLYDKVVEVDER
jgi:5-oxoprolinase (ATP-hydrolysing)